jgi:hypothetical protein
MRVNREEFLRALQAASPGLSVKESFEQSTCFVLENGEIVSYNDEVSVRCPSGLPDDWRAAVPAKKLLEILEKLGGDELDVELTDAELKLRGKGESAAVFVESEITLPFDGVDAPGDWADLHAEFGDAVKLVQECAGKDATQFFLTCVHVAPKWVEACDNHQITRYRIKTGFSESCLLRQAAVRHLHVLGVSEFSEGRAWVHFRNPDGLVISCRRYAEEYKDFSAILDVEGHPAQLPKGLGDAAAKAAVFSAEHKDVNLVKVELSAGKVRVVGQGVTGWYRKTHKISYDGEPLAFMISPDLLAGITAKHNDCTLSEKFLRVDGGKWTYVTRLTSPDAGAEEETEEVAAAPKGRRRKDAAEE